MAMTFLVLGGLFGGATVVGGEWRAGTVTTVLTFEPRRLRLHGARVASGAILAFAIATALQVLFLASFVPAVVAHGSAEGAGPAFWVDLGVAVLRTSAVTAAAAVLAMSLATLARNTAFAVIAVFAWVAVAESILRAVEPSLRPWLWAENLVTVLAWHRIDDIGPVRGPAAALATLAVYVGVVGLVAALAFRRRDLVAAT
jgi:ABC-2 type transport system permease protein